MTSEIMTGWTWNRILSLFGVECQVMKKLRRRYLSDISIKEKYQRKEIPMFSVYVFARLSCQIYMRKMFSVWSYLCLSTNSRTVVNTIRNSVSQLLFLFHWKLKLVNWPLERLHNARVRRDARSMRICEINFTAARAARNRLRNSGAQSLADCRG